MIQVKVISRMGGEEVLLKGTVDQYMAEFPNGTMNQVVITNIFTTEEIVQRCFDEGSWCDGRQIINMIKGLAPGQKMTAIKLLRLVTHLQKGNGLGLKEAKDFIES